MKLLFDLLIDVLNVKKVKRKITLLYLIFYHCYTFVFLGDIGLTEQAFIAVNGELGTGETNVEWQFI